MVLNDSHGYSTQAGTHAVSLAVVIYALLLGVDQWRMTATQCCIPEYNSHFAHTPGGKQ